MLYSHTQTECAEFTEKKRNGKKGKKRKAAGFYRIGLTLATIRTSNYKYNSQSDTLDRRGS